MLRFVVLGAILGGAEAFSSMMARRAFSSSSLVRMQMMNPDESSVGVSRRNLFVDATAAAVSLSVLSSSMVGVANAASTAATNKLEPYTDDICGFQVSVPAGWDKSEQALPDRRRISLFIDPSSSAPTSNDDKTLVFIAYTPVRDDFTQLSSFGSVDQVAQMTILPKGELAGLESDNKMISAESKKNAYFFDYTSRSPGQPLRHFRTIFTLAQGATGGAGAVLVTLTAQTPESRYGEMQGVFDEIIDSFGKAAKK
eukprot:CAMPEP_0198293102 /NCGR_PEP_ID=MMETSP1449-20131203/15443_1 /TAXON_ID=420275 /ORGANISM="Attheya septentrionalis, Strain CCMP2084" /LENGTH=254 /DNA_ID=CAMNT_0043992549 /DNA_START=67 /DNA_END=831 /DNA_ORIENTATION=-